MLGSRLQPRSSTPTEPSVHDKLESQKLGEPVSVSGESCCAEDKTQEEDKREKKEKMGNWGKERVLREIKDVRVSPNDKQATVNLKSFLFPRVWDVWWSSNRALFESGDIFAEASCGWKNWAHNFKASHLIWQACNTFCSESDAPLSFCSKRKLKYRKEGKLWSVDMFCILVTGRSLKCVSSSLQENLHLKQS